MKDIYVSIATYPDRFKVIIPTLQSLRWQSTKNFKVEIHVHKSSLCKNEDKAEDLFQFTREDSRFSVIAWDKDLGSYKKWLSCKLHKDAYILTGSDRVIYDRDFVKSHSYALDRNPRVVYNGEVYSSYVTEELNGVTIKLDNYKSMPGFYDIGFGSSFDSALINKCWFDLDYAFDTGVMNDDKFFHFILASHGIMNQKVDPHRKSHNESIPRLGKQPGTYNWKPLFEKLKSDKPDLFSNYVRNTTGFYDLMSNWRLK